MGLTKKQQKQASRQIRAKLTRLGLKNELQIVPSGKRVRVLVTDNKGQPMLDEHGHFKTNIVDRMIGTNVFKNTVRNLRKQPLAQIEAFLNLPEPKK